MTILKGNESKMEFRFVKIKAKLSGKKWDTAMKGLSKHGLTKVAVEGEYKIVELVG